MNMELIGLVLFQRSFGSNSERHYFGSDDRNDNGGLANQILEDIYKEFQEQDFSTESFRGTSETIQHPSPHHPDEIQTTSLTPDIHPPLIPSLLIQL